MRYNYDWIAKEADILLNDWEAIDVILYDEALEAESDNGGQGNLNASFIESEGKQDPTRASKTSSKSTMSIWQRIKRFFDNILTTIERFATEVMSKFQHYLVSDKEFLKSLNEFRKGHGLRKHVNVENGQYDYDYITNVISITILFVTGYYKVTSRYISDYHNKIMSNTATEEDLRDIENKMKNQFKGQTSLEALTSKLGIKVSDAANVHYLYNTIHNKFIGETKVISIGADGDQSYVRDAEAFLKSYNKEYVSLNKTINDIRRVCNSLKSELGNVVNATNTVFKTSNTLSQRVADYSKTIQMCLSILRMSASCLIEKAINSRMILQRAYGMQ